MLFYTKFSESADYKFYVLAIIYCINTLYIYIYTQQERGQGGF